MLNRCMTQFYTYIYRDPSRLNAKGFPEEIYVGKGFDNRAYVHLARKDKHEFVYRLQKLKRLGIAPSIEIINALDEDHALFMEVCLIDVIGRKDLGKGPLLNLTDGGEGVSGLTITPEVRAKHRQNNLDRLADPVKGPEWRQKISDGGKRWERTDETKAKMSRSSSWHRYNARTVTNEEKQQISERCRIKSLETQNRPEVKALHAANTKRIHSDPKIVASKSAKMKAYHAARRAAKAEAEWTESTLLSW